MPRLPVISFWWHRASTMNRLSCGNQFDCRVRAQVRPSSTLSNDRPKACWHGVKGWTACLPRTLWIRCPINLTELPDMTCPKALQLPFWVYSMTVRGRCRRTAFFVASYRHASTDSRLPAPMWVVASSSNAHGIEIANNSVYGNNGSYNGGVRVGQPFLELDTDGPYAFNTGVNIHNNSITHNGGLGGAGGGLSLATGSDNYNVSSNLVCGNFTTGDGGGIGHLGLSSGGTIADNRIVLNQSFNQARTVSGGGLFIGGEPSVVGALTQGSGSVDVDSNLFQGNHAGAGHGGAIRTQFVNGQDIANSNRPNGGARPRRWHRIRIRDNVIVNNVAGWTGGAIALQDTARSVIRRNTIAHNDSTATVGGLIVNNTSANQPAGISTAAHSAPLVAVIPVRPNTVQLREFSNPTMSGNTLWENRSFFYDATTGTSQLIPNLEQGAVGECVTGATFWDLDPLLGGSLTSATTPNPGFANPYCNGGRTLVTTPGAMFPLPALDEGGNAWIDVRFGPLTRAWPAGSPPWIYE